MECHDTIDRSCVRHDIKRLDVITIVMLDRYDATEFYILIMESRDRIFYIKFINGVPLFGHDRRRTIAQSTKSV